MSLFVFAIWKKCLKSLKIKLCQSILYIWVICYVCGLVCCFFFFLFKSTIWLGRVIGWLFCSSVTSEISSVHINVLIISLLLFSLDFWLYIKQQQQLDQSQDGIGSFPAAVHCGVGFFFLFSFMYFITWILHSRKCTFVCCGF